jgi:hypothetical protein
LLTEPRFLLAELQLVHVLSERAPIYIMEQLETLPDSPSARYYNILKRIEKEEGLRTQKTVLETLSWILYAKRELYMEELLAALAAKVKKLYPDEIPFTSQLF